MLACVYSFGFEKDMMGGNIAYTKKALYSANETLSYLQKMKKEQLIVSSIYVKLHSRLFEIRNDIGIYVQEVRVSLYFEMQRENRHRPAFQIHRYLTLIHQ